jgi:hypothetical protein
MVNRVFPGVLQPRPPFTQLQTYCRLEANNAVSALEEQQDDDWSRLSQS